MLDCNFNKGIDIWRRGHFTWEQKTNLFCLAENLNSWGVYPSSEIISCSNKSVAKNQKSPTNESFNEKLLKKHSSKASLAKTKGELVENRQGH